jgi:hypothetical protein
MITFTDVIDEVAEFNSNAAALQVDDPPPNGNAVRTMPTVFAGAEWKEGNHRHAGGSSADVFQAHGEENGPWRTLVVEVRSGGLKVFWEAGPVSLAAGELTARQIRADLAEALDGLAAAEFLPRGGLGLYVERSDAAFRDVVIEPLDP